MPTPAVPDRWADQRAPWMSPECDHAPTTGCQHCCDLCNRDLHRCPGCGQPTTHSDPVCPADDLD